MAPSSAHRPWILRLGLSLNCFINTPMWAMLLTSLAFVVFGLCSKHEWIRIVSVAYLPICLLEPANGSRYQWLYSYEFTERLRSLSTFRWVAAYFPVKLIKTAELVCPTSDSNNRAFLLAYHPHGVIGMGCCTALNTNACGFDRLFPGIKRFGVTLQLAFRAPIYREWMMAMGFVNADVKTLERNLRQGYSIVLVPGGAREALCAEPRSSRLIRRRGFIRLAKQTNAFLVPCYGFGENDAFRTIALRDGSFGRRIQNWIHGWLSASTPLLASPFCNQSPISVVVGAPIDTKAFSLEELEHVYWCALAKLYSEHRRACLYENVELQFDDS